MKKNKNVIIICIFAVAIIGYYFYLSNKPTNDPTDEVANTTKIEDTIAKDVVTVSNTPREAVKFYSTILECLYNESPSDEEITRLGNKARELLDAELLSNNPETSYVEDLKAEISDYSKAKRIIMSYAVESGDEVEYYTEEGKEYAVVNTSYTLRETEDFMKTNEEYILRKDEGGYWKVLGWRVATKAVTDDQNADE